MKTLAHGADVTMAEKALHWLLTLVKQLEVESVKEGRAFTEEALGKLMERGVLTHDVLLDHVGEWPKDNLCVAIDLIDSHHPLKAECPDANIVAAYDESGDIAAYLAAKKQKDR